MKRIIISLILTILASTMYSQTNDATSIKLTEELGNGIWKVYYRNVFLGFFDQRNLRHKQQATRLETNLV